MTSRNYNEHRVTERVEFEDRSALYADPQSDYADAELSESRRLLNEFLADVRERNQDAALVLDNPTDRQITDDQRIGAFDAIGDTANRFQGSSYTNEEAGVSDHKSVIVNTVNHMTADWHRSIENEQYWQALSYDAPPPACDERLADLEAEMADALAAGDSHLANEIWQEIEDLVTRYLADEPIAQSIIPGLQQALVGGAEYGNEFHTETASLTAGLGIAGGATLGLRQQRAQRRRRHTEDEAVGAGYDAAVA